MVLPHRAVVNATTAKASSIVETGTPVVTWVRATTHTSASAVPGRVRLMARIPAVATATTRPMTRSVSEA